MANNVLLAEFIGIDGSEIAQRITDEFDSLIEEDEETQIAGLKIIMELMVEEKSNAFG